MVARFIEGGYGVSEMEAHIEGDWVMYEDYAALENLLIAVVAAVGPCDIPDHLLDALCGAGVLEWPTNANVVSS